MMKELIHGIYIKPMIIFFYEAYGEGDNANYIVEMSLSSKNKKILNEVQFHEDYLVEQINKNYCVVLWNKKDQYVCITLYNSANEIIKEFKLKNVEFIRMSPFKEYIFIRTKINGKEVLILYDNNFNELNRVE